MDTDFLNREQNGVTPNLGKFWVVAREITNPFVDANRSDLHSSDQAYAGLKIQSRCLICRSFFFVQLGLSRYKIRRLLVMGSIRRRPETGTLMFDFRYRGKRCREQTSLSDTQQNRRRLETVLTKIDAAITSGTFVYRDYFPQSRMLKHFNDVESPILRSQNIDSPLEISVSELPIFSDFSEQWMEEFSVEWRESYRSNNAGILRNYLNPRFGNKRIDCIQRAEILSLRSDVAKRPGRGPNGKLSPGTVNDVLGLMSMIMQEAAIRFRIDDPSIGIKRLKVPRSDIHPFTLEEVQLLINSIRADYRDYLIVRFFTGMRSGELHGLKWRHVDFERRQIMVRETFTKGRLEYTKTDGSQRDIAMSQVVFNALKRQYTATSNCSEYVFCNNKGNPLSTENFTKRVWYPLLAYLGLAARRPYQSRHTAATLWLAAGENPEWIAAQLGHSTVEMLFRVYSRYVPNLTRQDGSAIDQISSRLLDSSSENGG